MKKLIYILFFLTFFISPNAKAQLSPGDLSDAHAEFEGLANCTKCHSIGNKVTDQKCLDCHKEIDELIYQKRGYHSSTEVSGKTCIDCHSEHHGKKFNAVKFDEEKFNHDLTSYTLEAAHGKIDCRKCHVPENISNLEIRKRDDTFLGMEKECLACHDDFHQETLGENCVDCHNIEAFRPAPSFNHDNADFKLIGAHQNVDCNECHQKTTKNGKDFQEFTDLKFTNCTDCHNDVHNGSLGANCIDCHNNNSWKNLNANNRFNHDLTDYPLIGYHQEVDCKKCHTSGNNTKPIKHNLCKDCHQDYHNQEFTSVNKLADCQDCHLVEKPFTYTLFGILEHEDADFKLEGAHIATPCFACHVSEDKWTFRNIGETCVDCHVNIHKEFISEKYFPEENCQSCHNSESWKEVKFDHSSTEWALIGKHEETNCRDCHIDFNYKQNIVKQEFKGIKTECTQCHDNIHGTQFTSSGKHDCTLCHTMAFTWNANNFDHNETNFPLEGKHQEVDCNECHKPKVFEDNVERVNYKIEKFECKDCHSL